MLEARIVAARTHLPMFVAQINTEKDGLIRNQSVFICA